MTARRARIARRAGPAGSDACARHRPAFVALVEGPDVADVGADAREHLDACGSCRAELANLLLTGIAVERAFAVARAADPAADSWPRLRARVHRQRSAPRSGRAASPILGLLLGGGVALSMLVPMGVPTADPAAIREVGLSQAAIDAAGQRDAAEEQRWLRATVLAGKEDAFDDAGNPGRVRLARYESAPIYQAAPLSAWPIPFRSPFGASVE